LSDITPVKSATIGKRKKADEKKAVGEVAESERLGRGSQTTASGRKNDPWDSLPPSHFTQDRKIPECFRFRQA
jgi:hypothetical protein